ncbi:MAG: hypothetical protein DMD26_03840 [Gemmatimonadetes bacterium]|nr:MAG: hypothetical protein DMD26_03840 [Gemmatimonadota bacterium]
MSLWRGRARSLVLAWAILQLAVSPGLSLIDGEFALRHSSLVVSHVEGHSSESCQRPHSADCVLCQFLSSQVASGSRTPAFPSPVDRFCRGAEAPVVFAASTTFDLPSSRAPPLA